ncbi:MAG TPA: hypothetical protein VJZ76_11540, partial [Thermoanaerobaculia bacterium]|nr:hypothetical protein [Thermoanaerobaculia bacterium]
MPLPKSVVCAACKRTYPEGWRRCPYCGHDDLRSRQESQARKFMARKVAEFEQRQGTQRKEERRGGGRRGQERPQPQGGGRPQQQRGQQSQPRQQQQPRAAEGGPERTGRRR